MAKSYIINALDIGSGFIKLISCAKKPGENDFEILSQQQQISSGVRKGVVIDFHKTSEVINSLVKKAEQMSGRKINNVYASVSGGHLCCIPSHGLVSVSRADQKISEEDVERVLQAAQTFPMSSNKEIIDVFPKEFIVDGEKGLKEVVGMEGVRLEADILALCGFSPYLKNSNQTILSSGLQINSLIPSCLASGRAILTSREKELGVCLLDIGAGTTEMAVFEEGSLIHAAVFPVGSSHITNDIAICLKTDIDTAERIKLEFGCCQENSKIKEKKIKIETEEEPVVFSRKELINIIEARVSEIFDLVNKELKKLSRQKLLPAGIALTGGGAKLPGIKDLAKKEFGLPCRIGICKIFPGIEADPSLSTLYGLVIEGADLEEEQGGFSTFGGGLKNKLKRLFRVFIP